VAEGAEGAPDGAPDGALDGELGTGEAAGERAGAFGRGGAAYANGVSRATAVTSVNVKRIIL
jgi:hypothetical protein